MQRLQNILYVTRGTAEEDDLLKEALELRALDMHLLRLCPCPVWLGRAVTRSRDNTRVAVAVDPQSTEPAGHDLALRMLRLSRELADTYSGENVLREVRCSLLALKPSGFVSPVKAY